MEELLVNVGLWVSYVLFGVAVAAAIIMPFINALSHPESLIKIGIGLAVLIVVFVIGYFTAGNEVTDKYIDYNVETPGMSKFVGGMLGMMYILFIIAAIGVVFSEINKALKS